MSSGNAPTHYQSQYSWDNRLKSAANQSSRPRGQRIDELTWDKQPEYEMDAHSGIWGSETLHGDNSDSRGKRKSERLRDLESQLESQRKALRQLEDECESEHQYERQNQTQSRDLSGSIDTDRHLEHTRGGGISSERHLEREGIRVVSPTFPFAPESFRPLSLSPRVVSSPGRFAHFPVRP